MVVSALLIGPEVVDVLQHLASFVSEASGATSQADLDRAGGDFAYAVTHVGVDVVLAILMHEATGGAGPERPPATQRFGAKVTPDGQVVSVPFDEIPGRGDTPMTTQSEGVSGEKGAAAIDTPINVELADLKWDQGHALENHGPQLTMEELEQRVLNQHPEMEQSRTALKFRDEATMKDAINQVLNRDSSKISNWVASPDQPELLLDPLDMGKSIGEGYTNTGTRRAPTSQLVPASEVTKVVVVVRLAPGSPRGWLVRTAYPKWP